MKTYTLEEIRIAFAKTFHNSGELWFGGEPDDFSNDWEDLEDNLGAEKKLCAVCGKEVDNSLCKECLERATGYYR